MAGLLEGGQHLGRARRSWPQKVIHEPLRPPSGPAAPTGPSGRPQPLRDPEARLSDRVVVAGTQDPSWTLLPSFSTKAGKRELEPSGMFLSECKGQDLWVTLLRGREMKAGG